MITVVGFLANTFERWILQAHSGSIEQGYYNISFQISAFCILFTSAMNPLIMREFAIAYGKDDLGRLRQLFIDIVPVLVTIATYFSLFLMFQADKIVVFVGGDKFQGAYLPVAIMTMFPIYQAYNQLNGSLLKATDQTKRFRDIGISIAVVGIPISYFLLASRGYLGLNLGASGLAVKIVVLQIITVNLRLWFNAKYLKLNFLLYVFHQFFILFAFSILSLVAKTISDFVISQSIGAFLLAGVIYTILTMSLLYCFPQTLFMSRDTLQKKYIQALIGLFKRRGSAR
jgi:O-antigen/teichoic acid export membrane protein